MVGRTITQRIQLVGGDEIKVAFEGLGNLGIGRRALHGGESRLDKLYQIVTVGTLN
jgi:hypothetical protein